MNNFVLLRGETYVFWQATNSNFSSAFCERGDGLTPSGARLECPGLSRIQRL